DAPNNRIRPFTSTSRQLRQNKFGGNQINFRNFLSNFDIKTTFQNKARGKGRGKAQVTTHSAQSQLVRKTPVSVRPRVPALFHAAGSHGQAHAEATIIEALPPRTPTARRHGR